MSVPNQKIVQIAPRTKRDSNHLFAMMNIDALQVAMRDLKGAHLRLWLYFNKNQDGYKFELSPKACSEWGIKKDSYYSGIEELIKKGYLIPIHYGSNIYQFYEIPQAEKATSQKATWFTETKNYDSAPTKKLSENPERNNTNITKIKQNKTIGDSYSQKSIHENAFAVGESGGSGKAATAHKDNYERFGDAPQEKKEYLASLGF